MKFLKSIPSAKTNYSINLIPLNLILFFSRPIEKIIIKAKTRVIHIFSVFVQLLFKLTQYQSKVIFNFFYALIIVSVTVPASVLAAVIIVDSNDGGGVTIDGNCSLAEATVAANFNIAIDACTAGVVGMDTIEFDPSLFSAAPFFAATISLSQSLNIDDGGVHIEPPVGMNLTLSGNSSNRIFQISDGQSTLRRLTLLTPRYNTVN